MTLKKPSTQLTKFLAGENPPSRLKISHLEVHGINRTLMGRANLLGYYYFFGGRFSNDGILSEM